MPNGNIFISYRRGADSGAAGRLYEQLIKSFPRDRLFFDIEEIPLGVDFTDVLTARVAQCDVQLVFIGQGWIDSIGRLKDETDWVRIEIETALQRANIPVVPILYEGASLPASEDLPETLRPLVRRNAFLLTHNTFSPMVDGPLKEQLRKILGLDNSNSETPTAPPPDPEPYDYSTPTNTAPDRDIYADTSNDPDPSPPAAAPEDDDGSMLIGCAFWIVLAVIIAGVLYWLFSGDGDSGEVTFIKRGDGMCVTGEQGANFSDGRASDMNSCNEVCFARDDCFAFSFFTSSNLCVVHTAPVINVRPATAECWEIE